MEPTSATSGEDFSHLPSIPEEANKYEILGVPQGASPENLKLAYRRLALLYHPDRHVESDRDLASEVFKRITAAYRTLSDPDERRRYDISLQRKEQFHERSGDETAVTLADILLEIDAYEHIFQNEDLPYVDAAVREMINKSLIQELGEQVVETWPMLSAPPGTTHQGSYQKGEVVLTNLRLLLPFTFAWEEIRGNIRYHYKGGAMPGVALPNVKQFRIVSHGRVRHSTQVEIEHSGGITQFKPATQNLCKLLLIARLWGIAVEAREVDNRAKELRWALRTPLKWLIGLTLTAFVVAGVVGLFADGVLATPWKMAVFFTEKGIWHWLVFSAALISAERLCRWILAYGRLDPKMCLINGAHIGGRASGQSSSTLAVPG